MTVLAWGGGTGASHLSPTPGPVGCHPPPSPLTFGEDTDKKRGALVQCLPKSKFTLNIKQTGNIYCHQAQGGLREEWEEESTAGSQLP